MRRGLLTMAAATALVAGGCKSAPAPNAAPGQPAATVQYLARPSVPPPAFKVFHHNDTSITLVTKDNATDAEIESLLWELHDAARAHTFDKLKIDQKWVDARDPMMSFHIYRGAKCASEKYAAGLLPCGDSYHAAGDYTLGGFTNRDRDDGVLLKDDGRQTELWNADAADSVKQGVTR